MMAKIARRDSLQARLRGVARRGSSFLACLLLILSMSMALLPSIVFADGEVFGSVANKTARPGVASSLGDLQVEGMSNNEIVIIVRATSGELEIDDSLVDVTGWGSRLVIRGSRDDVNGALQTLTLTMSNLGESTVTATLGDTVDGHLLVVDPDTGHGYMIVDDLYDEDTDELTSHKLNWPDARDAAELYEYQGATGYLATITSSMENEFISINLDNNGWIGASDGVVEGEWRWVAGPETGRQFWQSTDYNGDDQPLGGHAVNGMFNDWNSGEPNNQDTENCGEFIAGDGWNDLPCDSHTNGYVIEFGDENHSLTPLASTSFTVTVEGDVVNVGDCSELLALNGGNRYDTINLTNDIDCSGYDVEPLVGRETFKGTLNGNNHKIYNVKIDLPNDERVGLFARLEGATIDDLRLDNFSIIASEYAGALAGYSENATITNVHITNAEIDSEFGYAGGLIGAVELEDAGGYFMLEGVGVDGGAVTSLYGSNVGGLIGKVYVAVGNMLAHKVFADIDIVNEADDNGADTGGLFGELEAYSYDNYASQITVVDAYAWGEVYVPSGENVGGLVGKLGVEAWDEDAIATITIQNTYARGNVTASNEGGGLIGQLSSTDGSDGDVNYTISNSFAMGKAEVTNDTYTGGLVGRNETVESERTFVNNYYDQQRTGQTVCATDDNDGEPLTCTVVNSHGDQLGYFINNNTNAPMDTWNFNGVWVANPSIPPIFKQVNDSDNDGISDEIESASPNGGDANNDGILDSQQSNVASLVNSINGQYVAVALDNQNCRLTGVSVNSEDTNIIKDTGFNYTAGLVNFAADCGELGVTSMVNIYQYSITKDELVLRKYNPVTSAYFTIMGASIIDQVIDGHAAVVASYIITDGGDLDIDGKVDGTIVDPVGLASSVVDVPNTGVVKHWILSLR